MCFICLWTLGLYLNSPTKAMIFIYIEKSLKSVSKYYVMYWMSYWVNLGVVTCESLSHTESWTQRQAHYEIRMGLFSHVLLRFECDL